MVKNFIKNGTTIFTHKQTNILSAAVILMMAIFASRILGLFRDRLLAGTFFISGLEWQLDVYFAAFRIPDMLFQILILGALSAAFIPVFSQLLSKNEEKAWEVASTVINAGSLLFAAAAVIIFIWTPDFCQRIAPNFSFKELSLMVSLTRVMLLAQIFFIVSNILTGILQSQQRFLIPALAPVVYNLGIILGIVVISPFWGIYGPTIGIVIGAFLHFIIQLPLAMHLGFIYRPIIVFDAYVQKIVRLMVPRTLALAVSQIELTVAVWIATFLPAGSLSIFYFAQHLSDLPIGLFGLTIGQAALPVLSVEAERNQKYFKEILITSLREIYYLSLPASILLLVLRVPIVRLVLGARTFPWEATILTGKVVALFSLSIFAQSMIQILVRAFYALQNTKTPFLTAAAAVLVNVSLSFILTFSLKMQIFGLALATSLASIFHLVCLMVILEKEIFFLTKENFYIPMGKITFISLMTGAALWLLMKLLDKFILDTTKTLELLALTIFVSLLGLAFYLFCSYLFHIEELGRFFQILQRFGKWREILASSKEYLDKTKTSPSSLSGEE